MGKAWIARGSMKHAAENLVEQAYGLLGLSSAERRQRIPILLNNYHYADYPTTLPGRFNHPLATNVIHSVFFRSPDAMGNLYPVGFGPPITCELLALAFMVIRCTLDQYAETGTKTTITMDKATYEEVFLDLLFNIEHLTNDINEGPAFREYLNKVYVSAPRPDVP
jgi:Domain of unknown function (DUF6532)